MIQRITCREMIHQPFFLLHVDVHFAFVCQSYVRSSVKSNLRTWMWNLMVRKQRSEEWVRGFQIWVCGTFISYFLRSSCPFMRVCVRVVHACLHMRGVCLLVCEGL